MVIATSKFNKAFSLVEILVGIGLVTVLTVTALFVFSEFREATGASAKNKEILDQLEIAAKTIKEDVAESVRLENSVFDSSDQMHGIFLEETADQLRLTMYKNLHPMTTEVSLMATGLQVTRVASVDDEVYEAFHNAAETQRFPLMVSSPNAKVGFRDFAEFASSTDQFSLRIDPNIHLQSYASLEATSGPFQMNLLTAVIYELDKNEGKLKRILSSSPTSTPFSEQIVLGQVSDMDLSFQFASYDGSPRLIPDTPISDLNAEYTSGGVAVLPGDPNRVRPQDIVGVTGKILLGLDSDGKFLANHSDADRVIDFTFTTLPHAFADNADDLLDITNPTCQNLRAFQCREESDGTQRCAEYFNNSDPSAVNWEGYRLGGDGCLCGTDEQGDYQSDWILNPVRHDWWDTSPGGGREKLEACARARPCSHYGNRFQYWADRDNPHHFLACRCINKELDDSGNVVDSILDISTTGYQLTNRPLFAGDVREGISGTPLIETAGDTSISCSYWSGGKPMHQNHPRSCYGALKDAVGDSTGLANSHEEIATVTPNVFRETCQCRTSRRDENGNFLNNTFSVMNDYKALCATNVTIHQSPTLNPEPLCPNAIEALGTPIDLDGELFHYQYKIHDTTNDPNNDAEALDDFTAAMCHCMRNQGTTSFRLTDPRTNDFRINGGSPGPNGESYQGMAVRSPEFANPILCAKRYCEKISDNSQSPSCCVENSGAVLASFDDSEIDPQYIGMKNYCSKQCRRRDSSDIRTNDSRLSILVNYSSEEDLPLWCGGTADTDDGNDDDGGRY